MCDEVELYYRTVKILYMLYHIVYSLLFIFTHCVSIGLQSFCLLARVFFLFKSNNLSTRVVDFFIFHLSLTAITLFFVLSPPLLAECSFKTFLLTGLSLH